MRLATVENESYANNSTGEWVSLFGTRLPSTAAAPAVRISYLKRQASSGDPRVRKVVVDAAKGALSWSEWALVLGELQGGVIVEPRGGAATLSDAFNYQSEMIDILGALADDPDTSVSDSALRALIESIQPSLLVDQVRDHLSAALATLSPAQVREVRAELSSLGALYDRADDTEAEADGINAVAAALPKESPQDRLWLILHSQDWDRSSAEIEADLSALLAQMPDGDASQTLLDSLSEAIPTDFACSVICFRPRRAMRWSEYWLTNSLDRTHARCWATCWAVKSGNPVRLTASSTSSQLTTA